MAEGPTSSIPEPQALKQARRLLVVGLDGATFSLLDGWMTAGLMPNLRRLSTEGTRATLQSVAPLSRVAAWASFATGVPPGEHGLFGIFQQPRRAAPHGASGQGTTVPPVWELLTEAGLRVGLVNLPTGHLIPETAAFTIANQPAPSAGASLTRPGDLLMQLRSELGDSAVKPPELSLGDPESVRRFLADLARTTCQHARCACHFMQTHEWDCCLVVLSAIDLLQQWLWDVLAKGFPSEVGAPQNSELREQVEALLLDLDHCFGDLLDACTADTDVLVVSAYGYGPVHWQFRVNYWLAALGLLAPAQPSPLARLLAPLTRFSCVGGPAASPSHLGIDWHQTQAYACADSYLGIRVNLRGREPLGVVSPGAEYERVRARIQEEIQKLRHPDSGEPLVAAVLRREEAFAGHASADAPDVYAVLSDGAVASDLRLDGPLFARTELRTRMGNPCPDGVFIARGPHFRPAQTLSDISLTDVLPVILRLLAVPVPSHVRGRLPVGLLTAEAEATPPRPPRAGRSDGGNPYTDEESRQVEERLRGLGYL